MRIRSMSQRSRKTTLSNVVCDFTVAHRKPYWLLATGYWLSTERHW